MADYLILDKAYAAVLPAPKPPAFGNATDPSLPLTASEESWLERDNVYRQCFSLFVIAAFGAAVIYFISASLSYSFIFDKRLEYHPRFLKNQKRLEVQSSLTAIPIISVLTLPFFLGEVRGYSLLYTKIEEYGWSWIFISTLLYMLFNDIGIYWIHRLEHHPSVYKYIHKPHHKWISMHCLSAFLITQLTVAVPTPWAAIAFHPLDGFAQSLPYQ